MPKKKRPKILNLPICYGLELLMAGAFPDPKSTDNKAAVATFFEQQAERLRAVYEYFGIDPAAATAKDDLIYAMCLELFPQGFSLRLGRKKKSNAGNKQQWTVKRRRALVEIVEAYDRIGLKPARAFKDIGDYYGQDAGSIKARYYEAVKVLKRDFKSLDPADQLEIMRLRANLSRTELGH